jgi:glycosyltransferase involved in cell wall biosynthesis
MKIVLFANTDWYLYNFRLSLLRSLKEGGHDVLLVTPPGPHGARLGELGFRWEGAPMERRSLNPLRELGLIRWLSALMARERPDLVHGFTIKCAVYGSLAARWARVPCVNSVTGLGYVFTSDDLRARMLRPIVTRLLRLALDTDRCRVILQNPDDVALFQRSRLVDAKRIRLVPSSGVDCSRFAPTPAGEGSRDGRAFKVLLPARLLWDKGLREYVEAARIVRQQAPGIRFLLAGAPDPGNPAAASIETVDAWAKEGVLTWLGHVEDMPALFRSVDVVVLPSYREGLPKGLIEAGACGVPLVTTDAPGCREVVSHEVDGLIVPVRDAAALAAAIVRVWADPALRLRLGRASREKVLRNYDDRIVIHKTMAVYRELLPE